MSETVLEKMDLMAWIKPNSEQSCSKQSSQNAYHSAEANSHSHYDKSKKNWRQNLIVAVPEKNSQQRGGKAAKYKSDGRVHQPESLKALLLHAADMQSSLRSC